MSRVYRLLVTGREGQVVQSIVERAAPDASITIITASRPEFDLAKPDAIAAFIAAQKPDLIISAAAYTAVDQAETDAQTAFAVNAEGPRALAKAAKTLSIPIIHLSTDYVFDGSKSAPYLEGDPVAPLGVYGQSKLQGEQAIAAETDNYVILRTAWVYSPFGRNFLKTMLKLAETRDEVNVVADQIGNPTSALDIADAVLVVARNLLHHETADLRGIFHMTGQGCASWAEFASEIFRVSAEKGGHSAKVNPIPSSAYPTPAKRPANSQLDSSKLAKMHGVTLPLWQEATAVVLSRLSNAGA